MNISFRYLFVETGGRMLRCFEVIVGGGVFFKVVVGL